MVRAVSYPGLEMFAVSRAIPERRPFTVKAASRSPAGMVTEGGISMAPLSLESITSMSSSRGLSMPTVAVAAPPRITPAAGQVERCSRRTSSVCAVPR